MHCDNRFCVYYREEGCRRKETCLDQGRRCLDYLYLRLPEKMLKGERAWALKQPDRWRRKQRKYKGRARARSFLFIEGKGWKDSSLALRMTGRRERRVVILRSGCDEESK